MPLIKTLPFLILLAFSSFTFGHQEHISEEIAEIVILEDSVESPSEAYAPKSLDLKKIIGRLHPVLIHFPIACLILAAFSEWSAFLFKESRARTVALTMLWVGSISAILAGLSGWILASGKRFIDEDAELLFNHRWLGVSVVALSILTLASIHLLKQSKLRDTVYRVLLTVLAILVGFTGHFGGALIYGADYLSP